MSVYELSHSMGHAGVGGETGLGRAPGGKRGEGKDKQQVQADYKNKGS